MSFVFLEKKDPTRLAQPAAPQKHRSGRSAVAARSPGRSTEAEGRSQPFNTSHLRPFACDSEQLDDRAGSPRPVAKSVGLYRACLRGRNEWQSCRTCPESRGCSGHGRANRSQLQRFRGSRATSDTVDFGCCRSGRDCERGHGARTLLRRRMPGRGCRRTGLGMSQAVPGRVVNGRGAMQNGRLND